jgi:hypothetical protein
MDCFKRVPDAVLANFADDLVGTNVRIEHCANSAVIRQGKSCAIAVPVETLS